MNPREAPPPRAELARNVALRRHALDAALAEFGRMSTARLVVGSAPSRHPWRWLLGAMVAGFAFGFRRVWR